MDAIEYFKGMRKRLCEDHLKLLPKKSVGYQTTLREMAFYDMAIKALEQQPKLLQALEHEKGAYNALVKNIQCSDAISRQAALKRWDELSVRGRTEFDQALMMLPSVSVAEKTGHWIEHEHNGIGHIECSECQSWFLMAHLLKNSYCPNCGARMVEPQESEDKDE